jgi:hypothetical protein
MWATLGPSFLSIRYGRYWRIGRTMAPIHLIDNSGSQRSCLLDARTSH